MPADTALVTGCSGGIGRAAAEAFADEGWTVYATAREEGDLAALDEEFEAVELDVTDGAQCAAAVDRVLSERGHLDCLVNNAGFGQLGAVEDLRPHRLHRQMDVNLYGPHRLIREALPHMREAESGRIVNVSSFLAHVGVPGMGAYGASKAALDAMSEALRREVADFDVEVVLIEPGFVTTDFGDRAMDELAGLDESGAYDDLYGAYDDREFVVEVAGDSPAAVADAVVHAATCSDPAPRVRVGQVSELTHYADFLPDRWQDRVVSLVRRVLR